ncbi:MAG: hypothetical protein AB1758_13370 [Candidatus Eremiobacterota bacterium]
MRFLLWLSLAALALAAPALIEPGRGVGPVGPATVRADLDRLGLPEGQLMDGEDSTEVWALERERRYVVSWVQGKAARVLIRGERSVYSTAEGVTLGTPLSRLEALNQGPLRFRSFEGESAGRVTDWEGGRLQGWRGRLELTLSWKTPTYGGLSGPEKERLEQPGLLLRSSDPLCGRLDPIVEAMEVILGSGAAPGPSPR